MPSDEGRRGRRFADHRVILEGIAWRLRTGAPWRDLPADCLMADGWRKRHRRFLFDGTYQRMLEVVRRGCRDDGLDEGVARLLSVDSTVVRAHQHAAGASAAGDTGG